MSITDDPNHPGLTHGADVSPTGQAAVYLVLSDAERAKGFVRPVRRSYIHTGLRPRYPLRDLTPEEHARYDLDGSLGYVKFETYPESEAPKTGRFWTQVELDGRGCQATTTMGLALAETYARNPNFYGATYCVNCQMHRPVAEFVWEDGAVVGT